MGWVLLEHGPSTNTQLAYMALALGQGGLLGRDPGHACSFCVFLPFVSPNLGSDESSTLWAWEETCKGLGTGKWLEMTQQSINWKRIGCFLPYDRSGGEKEGIQIFWKWGNEDRTEGRKVQKGKRTAVHFISCGHCPSAIDWKKSPNEVWEFQPRKWLKGQDSGYNKSHTVTFIQKERFADPIACFLVK